MLILSLGILVIVFVVFLIVRAKKVYRGKDTEFLSVMCCIFGLSSLGVILAICNLSVKVATENTIDSKILMYQEENDKIEKAIDEIVKGYLEFEHKTFSDLKTEDISINMVTLFPELKSDNLVKQQLEIYISNNEKIKTLREEKIDMAKMKWILYFGK